MVSMAPYSRTDKQGVVSVKKHDSQNKTSENVLFCFTWYHKLAKFSLENNLLGANIITRGNLNPKTY